MGPPSCHPSGTWGLEVAYRLWKFFWPVLLTRFDISEHLINNARRSFKSANLACSQKGGYLFLFMSYWIIYLQIYWNFQSINKILKSRYIGIILLIPFILLKSILSEPRWLPINSKSSYLNIWHTVINYVALEYILILFIIVLLFTFVWCICVACCLFNVFVFSDIDIDCSVFSNGYVKCVCYRGWMYNFSHLPEIQIQGQAVVSIVKTLGFIKSKEFWLSCWVWCVNSAVCGASLSWRFFLI